MAKNLILITVLFIFNSCTELEKPTIDYTFFVVGHSYGSPSETVSGLDDGFMDQIDIINADSLIQMGFFTGYLVKKSTVSELAVDKIVEIIGGPFKGMKATITRVDFDKEEATVILLDAPYQLPVTVDANYLKLSAA